MWHNQNNVLQRHCLYIVAIMARYMSAKSIIPSILSSMSTCHVLQLGDRYDHTVVNFF
jgi:hypothetical protein